MARKGATPQEQAARDARLLGVAGDLLGNPNLKQVELAQKYGVSQSQISADIRKLRREWQASALAKTDERVGIQDQQYNALIAAFWPKAMKADGFAADRVLQAMAQQAKLLGLDRPEKQQVEMDGGMRLEIVGMRDEELP